MGAPGPGSEATGGHRPCAAVWLHAGMGTPGRGPQQQEVPPFDLLQCPAWGPSGSCPAPDTAFARQEETYLWKQLSHYFLESVKNRVYMNVCENLP